jgi:hypothetical protein
MPYLYPRHISYCVEPPWGALERNAEVATPWFGLGAGEGEWKDRKNKNEKKGLFQHAGRTHVNTSRY